MAEALEPTPVPKKPSSKRGFFLLLVLGLCIVGGGFFLLKTPEGRKLIGLDLPAKTSKKSPERELGTPGIYVNVPDLLINLKSEDSKGHFLKLCLTLETKSQKDANYVTKVMPKIVDSFQVYLLELRIEDIKGAEGIYRLKQNLLARVNAEISPLEVSEVLFRDMLVQ